MPYGCTLCSVPELQIQEMLSAFSPPCLNILTSQFSHSVKQEISKNKNQKPTCKVGCVWRKEWKPTCTRGSDSEETGGDQVPVALISKFLWKEIVLLVVILISLWALVSWFYTQHSCYTHLCSEERWLGLGWLCVNQQTVLVQNPKGSIWMYAKERNQWPEWGQPCCFSEPGLHEDTHCKSPCNPWASVFGICALWTL